MSGIKGGKCDSGSAKRKRKADEVILVASQSGALMKFLTAPALIASGTSTATPDDDESLSRVAVNERSHEPIMVSAVCADTEQSTTCDVIALKSESEVAQVVEMAVLKPNDTEKLQQADDMIDIVDVQFSGAFGRLYLSGSEAEIEEAAKAVHKAISGVEGRENKAGSGPA